MMRGTLRAIFNYALATAATLMLASAAHAQSATTTRDATPSSTATPNARAEESGAEPDLSITARVTADSLRFEKVPDPKVEFTGKPRRGTVWKSERENLPEQVQPGVTYRDIGITLRITSVFADIDRIVAEALGEVPASDGAQPQAAPAARPDANPPAPALQVTRPAKTPSPAKAATRASARGRVERRGRGL
jgi:hypothetical protein